MYLPYGGALINIRSWPYGVVLSTATTTTAPRIHHINARDETRRIFNHPRQSILDPTGHSRGSIYSTTPENVFCRKRKCATR